MTNPQPGRDADADLTGDARELIAADADDDDRTTSAPSDNTTLTSVVEGLAGEGYVASFTARPEGELECGACGTSSSASDYAAHTIRRMEGASDPDDMVAVVAAQCPRCEALGVAVLAFGPASSAADADVLARLDLRPESFSA